MRDVGVGSRLGSYEILGFLGRGSRSSVYVARHLTVGTLTALRIFGPDPGDVARFERHRPRYVELSNVAHDHLACVLAVGLADGLGCVALTLARGPKLDTLLSAGPLPQRQVAQVIDQLASALDALHGAGVVHGDVRPGAVLFDGDPGVKMTPVLLADPNPSASASATPGAESFMAPERIGGAPATRSSDVYSLGCLLFHCLSGHAPFEGPDDSSTLQSHLMASPPTLTRVASGAPWAGAVDEVVARAMAKYPRDRFDSCRELAAAAGRALSGSPGPAQSDSDTAGGPAAPMGHARLDAPEHERPRDLPLGLDDNSDSWGSPPASATSDPWAPRSDALTDLRLPTDDAPRSSHLPPPTGVAPPADPWRSPRFEPTPEPPTPTPTSNDWLPELDREPSVGTGYDPGPPPAPPGSRLDRPAPDGPTVGSDTGGSGGSFEWAADENSGAEDLSASGAAVRTTPAGVDTGSGELANFTVFAPGDVARGQSFQVQVLAETMDDAALLRAISSDSGMDAADGGIRTLASRLPRESTLHVDLRMDGLAVDHPVVRIDWRQKGQTVDFRVAVPPGAHPGRVSGIVGVSQNTVPIGHVRFGVNVVDPRLSPLRNAEAVPVGIEARRYRTAYAAFAPGDRESVRARARLLPAAGVELIAGTGSTPEGKDAEAEAVADTDLFLLFWSSEAQGSEAVRRELEQALGRQGPSHTGRPYVRAVLLAAAPPTASWPELESVGLGELSRYVLSAAS